MEVYGPDLGIVDFQPWAEHPRTLDSVCTHPASIVKCFPSSFWVLIMRAYVYLWSGFCLDAGHIIFFKVCFLDP